MPKSSERENIHKPFKDLIKKKRRGNATTLKERPGKDGYFKVAENNFQTLNPKVSYSALKRFSPSKSNLNQSD